MDRGVGLGAGEIMLFGGDSQTFDWWRTQVPDAFIPGTNLNEDFEHNGLLDNKI